MFARVSTSTTRTTMYVVSICAALCGVLLHTSAASAACGDVALDDKYSVYHGSPISPGGFAWVGGLPPPPFKHAPVPDGPAWFAFTDEFSIHAGLRYAAGKNDSMYVHQYLLPNHGISVKWCDTHAEMSAFIAKLQNPSVVNDGAMGRTFCNDDKVKFQYNAYLILKDQVRQEPELIVCQPSDVLKYASSSKWEVGTPGGSKYYAYLKATNGSLLRAYELDTTNLTSFKKVL
jgi:hypothetical protein